MRRIVAWVFVLVAIAAHADALSDARPMLDAPLLFVKRHSYTGIHIYDTYYKWPPGGGGIYVLENPADPPAQHRIRPIIDATTPGTLGNGVYTHPELSFDATRLLFCYKGEPTGNTSIYEIGVDGKGLRRLSDPGPTCSDYHGSQAGQHDVAPCYLPDGRIACLSTRPSGLVPCNNTGVAVLHVMNADGSDLHPISVNFVNEFDPVVMPDGRLLFGRWEYVDKNALTIQSLWTSRPDGSEETAYYANNMVLPEAILDVRPVPGTALVVGTFAKHNSTPRGSIAMVDARLGKNNVKAITNFEHPDQPTFDTGDSCEPWPLDRDTVLFSGRPAGSARNVLQILTRSGERQTLLADPAICLHSPMLIKPRPVPPVLPAVANRDADMGRFVVKDIYRGLDGIKRGEVKSLRVLEETSRVSERSGANPFNQVFLVSAALAFSVKNVLGVVPVDADGAASFDVPAGRAVFFQALDADGRLVRSMRTFIQAVPGATRSCVGCHEDRNTAPSNDAASRSLLPKLEAPAARLVDESWGSGYLDYPSQVQPVLDRHCASCHGGDKDIAAGLDLSGGWTEFFSISYENLVNRRRSQLTADLIAGIDCMNGTAWWSSQIFGPRGHGSGAAPLAALLVDGHGGRIPDLTRRERDLLMAWIDTNGQYHGTWDMAPGGQCDTNGWTATRAALSQQMNVAGCVKCHGGRFEDDWFNLEQPEQSRILRAPMAAGQPGALTWCRQRAVGQDPRVRLLVSGYAHAVMPAEQFPRREWQPADRSGEPVASFASSADPNYQAMLATIRRGREMALAKPRVDQPGVQVVAGAQRMYRPPMPPETAPPLSASVDDDGVVTLAWERSARTIGLEAVVARGDKTIADTPLFACADAAAPTGRAEYSLVVSARGRRSQPSHVTLEVPAAKPPAAPTGLTAGAQPNAVRLSWSAVERAAGYVVDRALEGQPPVRLTAEPIALPTYTDGSGEAGRAYRYTVSAVSRRAVAGPPSAPVTGTAVALKGPVLDLPLTSLADGRLWDGSALTGRLAGGAQITADGLKIGPTGSLTLPHHEQFDLTGPFSVDFRVFIEQAGDMPVLVSCGLWQQAGWFVQRLGGAWRWHVGGLDCDGGQPAVAKWIRLTGVWDGQEARLYQDGQLVGKVAGRVNSAPFGGPLMVGQYSGGPAPSFQVVGRIKAVGLHRRALTPEEIKP
ncbi:MAG: hypothetical protein HZB16_07460 [Armatimonadetes bacterium]|nr:hypothetical protein [Armatimonadota bacterium]